MPKFDLSGTLCHHMVDKYILSTWLPTDAYEEWEWRRVRLMHQMKRDDLSVAEMVRLRILNTPELYRCCSFTAIY